jgi:hypothetical protein
MSCKSFELTKQKKYAKRQNKIMIKQLRKDYKFALKQHHKLQSDATLKMMKNSKKRFGKLNNFREKSFFGNLSGCKKTKSE